MSLVACTGAPSEPALESLPDLGWATEIVQDPSAFSALMDATDREVWVALHAHDYGQVALQDGRADEVAWRGARANMRTHQALQRVASEATRRYVRGVQARGTLADDRASKMVLTMAEACEARAAQVPAWDGTPSGAPPELPASDLDAAEQAVVRAHVADPSAKWLSEAGEHLSPVARHARNSMDGGNAPITDLISEIDADQNPVRTWQDPCVHLAMIDPLVRGGSVSRPSPAPAIPALADTLFSARGVDLTQLGLPTETPDTDDAQAAREEIRAMDALLDATRAHLETTADADGLALLQQIRPLTRLRQEVLVDRAERDLRAGHVQRAYATLLLARDVTEREIGVENGPALFALLAEANLVAGRSREALDALQPLVARYHETAATREIVSDLVVLEGMDRTGDSKEH